MTETVTPVKFRAADGVVYERTGEKREPLPGELHWCEATRPAPYAFRWPKRTRWSPNSSWVIPEDAPCTPRPCKHCGRPKADHERNNCPRFHKCAIWKVSTDQDWQPPQPTPTQFQNPIDQLIQRVQLTAGDLDGNNIPVLAMLYQAKALERIADQISEQSALRANTVPHPATNADLAAVGVYICTNCQHDEHAECLVPGECHCVVCHQPPTLDGYKEDFTAGVTFRTLRHSFIGMEDNHYCTQCGGGRLHPIHQI